jgi:MFS family permease
MRRIHSPVLLGNVEDTKARAFVFLFTCDAFARAILITLVPLQAYALLGAAQVVSVVYFLVAIAGLGGSLAVPLVLHWVRRRWVLTIGAGAQVSSALLLALGTKASLVVGLALQALAMAVLDVVVNLYMLDHIPRRRLSNFEPRRLLFAGSAFAAGPWVGVYLHRNVAENSTYLVAALSTLTMLTFFWTLRLADNPSLQAATAPPPSPLSFVPRFVSQPRLVLSWVLALGRNGWWVMNFIYTPIYVTNAGYRAEVGGALVSLGLAPMLLVQVWGRLGQAIGTRNLLSIGYGVTGSLSLAAAGAALASMPLACMTLLCLAAFAATIIDGAGNVPFLRAVHHYERAAMTSVFMTFRHVGALVVPGVLAVVLWALPLPFVFAAGGLHWSDSGDPPAPEPIAS